MSQAGAPSQSSSQSSIFDVIKDRDLGKIGWPKVESNHELTQLHQRFWGRPVSKPTNVMISEEDDIKEDCFVLELGEETFEPSKIWVRAEYIRIFKCILEYYKRITESGQKAPSFVVTGQPGIGKRVFLYYVLYRCLAEKRPVIWFYLNTLFIFVDEGVYKMGLISEDFFSPKFKIKVWTLVDSDQDKEGIPKQLVPRGTPLSVIYATSPAKERWSRLHKTTTPTVIVMNPWSRGEIHQVADLFPTKKDSKMVDDAFDHLGPTPRLCLETVFHSPWLVQYKEDRSTTLEEMTLETLRTLVDNVKNLNMDKASHKLFLIKRAPGAEETEHWPKFLLQPITKDIQSRMGIRMRNLDFRLQVQMFLSYSRVPRLKGMAGPMFEGLGHRQFQRHISIYYSPMVRLTNKNSNAKNQPQYHSSHIPLNKDLETKRKVALECTLDVQPSDVREYDDKDLPNLHPEEGVYYIPKKENEVALDSFIRSSGRIHMFQFTVSNSHDVNPGLVSRFSKFPPLNEWHFIFVIPDYVEVFKSPYPSTPELQALKHFSCQVTMDEDQGVKAVPRESSEGKTLPVSEGGEEPSRKMPPVPPESSKGKTPLVSEGSEEPSPKKKKKESRR